MNHQGMKFSLISREVIADSVELVVRGHAYDGIVGIGGCDKNLPGLMMGMVRCNVPSVFLFGGSALTGTWRGKDISVLDAFEAVGALMTQDMTIEEVDELGAGLSTDNWRMCWAVHSQYHGHGIGGLKPRA